MTNFLVLVSFLSVLSVVTCKSVNSQDTWSGKWFPFNPSETTTTTTQTPRNYQEESEDVDHLKLKADNDWKGRWFPSDPNKSPATDCDDDLDSAETDFNYNEIVSDSYQFLCLDDKRNYEPNITVNPVQKEHIIPPAFQPTAVCTNESISYPGISLPTFGSYRPNPPAYGLYKFLPIQRWMHTLKLGGIVGLYHPCANKMQVDKFKSTIQSCLYSYVITPSNLLTAKRPLAVLSYGRSLELSVLEPRFIRDFIRSKNKTVEVLEHAQWYNKGILKEAKLVTTLSDDKLCPYSE